MKLVSVIMPVFGVEKYIAEALKSVLNQSHSELEIIVVNDGTKDDSMQIVKNFKDSRIRIIEQENRGLASARNSGIGTAVGEYVALLDPDDVWLPRKIELQLADLEISPQVGINYGVSQMTDEEGLPTGFFQRYNSLNIGPRDLLISNPVGNGSSPLIRIKALEELARIEGTPKGIVFDPALKRCEDLDCWLRLAIKTSWGFQGLPQTLVRYRLRSSGLSGDFVSQYDSFEQLLEKLSTYAPELVSQCGSKARARHLRYGACCALRAFQSDCAKNFIDRAIREDPQILLDLPLRVSSVYFRVLLQKLFSRKKYVQLERLVGRLIPE